MTHLSKEALTVSVKVSELISNCPHKARRNLVYALVVVLAAFVVAFYLIQNVSRPLKSESNYVTALDEDFIDSELRKIDCVVESADSHFSKDAHGARGGYIHYSIVSRNSAIEETEINKFAINSVIRFYELNNFKAIARKNTVIVYGSDNSVAEIAINASDFKYHDSFVQFRLEILFSRG